MTRMIVGVLAGFALIVVGSMFMNPGLWSGLQLWLASCAFACAWMTLWRGSTP